MLFFASPLHLLIFPIHSTTCHLRRSSSLLFLLHFPIASRDPSVRPTNNFIHCSTTHETHRPTDGSFESAVPEASSCDRDRTWATRNPLRIVTMNVLLSPQPPLFPHQHETARLSPPRSGKFISHFATIFRVCIHRRLCIRSKRQISLNPSSMWRPKFDTPTNQRHTASPYNMATRKRKADEDNDEMSLSPLSSPATSSRQLSRPSKKFRQANDHMAGRPLALPRLLETLDTQQLRTVLQTICEVHPTIGQEVVSQAPRPSVEAALQVIADYKKKYTDAVPFGNGSSDYTYFRVKQHLVALLDAISDFTPQFLPPLEQQTNQSLQYLDEATKTIASLPDWESSQYRHHKDNAYDEISRAWALVITEASKRGGGFVLHTGGWDQILAKHNQQSGGKMRHAMNAMATEVGWMGHNPNLPNHQQQSGSSTGSSDPNSILNQLMNGSYGSPVRVGPW